MHVTRPNPLALMSALDYSHTLEEKAELTESEVAVLILANAMRFQFYEMQNEINMLRSRIAVYELRNMS